MTRRYRVAALLAVVVGWALRLHNLGGPELWFDEAASHFIAARPPSEILRYVAAAPFEHPPLYYLLLHGAMRVFGETEWALRFPSVLLGIVLLVGLWLSGRSLGGVSLGLAALSFAAVSPFLITYAQEARMYALLQCLGLLSTAVLHRALVRGGWAAWIPYGLVMVLGVTTHYFFAFLLPTHALLAPVLEPERSRRPFRSLLLALGAMVGGGALAILLLPGPRGAAEQMLREALWGKSPQAIGRLLLDWAYGGAIITDRPAWSAPLSTVSLLLPAVGLFAATIPRRTRAALGLWVLVPTVIAIAIPYGGLVLRHFSYVTPALCLLAGAGLVAMARRSPALGALAALVVAVTALPGLVWLGSGGKGHYRAAVQHVTEGYREGDLVLLGNPHQWVPFTYYNRTGLDSCPLGDGRPLPLAELAGADRVWLLEWETWAVPDMETLREALHGRAAEAYHLDFSPDVRLTLLYRVPSGPATATTAPWSWTERYAISEAAVWDATLVPGDAILARLCWAGGVPADAEAAIALRLADDAGRVWAQSVSAPGTAGPSLAADCAVYALAIPGGTPPGRYRAEVGLIERVSGAQPAATAADGSPLGPWVRVDEVDVGFSAYPAPPVSAGTGGPIGAGMWLVGSETDRTGLDAGSAWTGIVQVETEETMTVPELALRLVGVKQTRDLGVASPCAPLSDRGPRPGGVVVRCPLTVHLPADLPAGDYRLQVTVPGHAERPRLLGWLSGEGGGWATVDSFIVAARPANHVESQPSQRLQVDFGSAIRLAGFDQARDGETLRLTLYWQALARPEDKLKVFVHLARPNEGEPLAQDDRPPASISTDEWLAGETFASQHVLPLPLQEKDLRLRIGLYSERTMQRLPAAGPGAGADYLELVVEAGGLIPAP